MSLIVVVNTKQLELKPRWVMKSGYEIGNEIGIPVIKALADKNAIVRFAF